MNDEAEQMAKVIHAYQHGTAECRRAMMEASRESPGRRRMGTVRDAAQIGQCHPRTLARYAKKGLLRPAHISPRCVRWDLDEVERLFTQGVAEDSGSNV